MPLADFAVAFGGFVLLKQLWASQWANNVDYYPAEYTYLVIPIYILILICSSWLGGGYDKPVRPMRMVKGMGVGLLLLLSFYSLLDEGQRYSRMLLLAGSAWTLVGSLLLRVVLSAMHIKGYALRARRRGNVLVIGTEAEAARVRRLYLSMGMSAENVITGAPGQADRLEELIRVERVEEVVFCGADVDLKDIISHMATLKTTGVEYKIAPADGDFVIGSESILSRENLYLDNLEMVTTDTCRRTKRLFDLGTSLLLLLLSPLLFWFQCRKRHYFGDCLQVFVGHCSWVGYRGRKGVFVPADIAGSVSPEVQERFMLRYMRHYKTSTDAAILLKNWNRL